MYYDKSFTKEDLKSCDGTSWLQTKNLVCSNTNLLRNMKEIQLTDYQIEKIREIEHTYQREC